MVNMRGDSTVPINIQWMNRHGIVTRKISWRELWDIKFIVGATDDVICRTSVSGVGEDGNCKLCLGVGSLKHILSGCKTSLTQGRYMQRHNQALKSFVCLFEDKRVVVAGMLA